METLSQTRKIVGEARQAGRLAAEKKLDELLKAGPKFEVFDVDLGGRPKPGAKRYPMLDLCGDADIYITNHRSKFWKDFKKLADNRTNRLYCSGVGPYGGWISIFDMTRQQEISVNEAANRAAAAVLQEHGIDCHVRTRLD